MGTGLATRPSDEDDVEMLSDINVTPLVDVVLVLLIMFMIIIPTMLATAPIDVGLGASSPAAAMDRSMLDLTPLEFILKKNGDNVVLYLNGQPVSTDEVKGILRNLRANGTEPSGKLSAEAGVPYGELIRVVDLLTALEFKDLALDTHTHTE